MIFFYPMNTDFKELAVSYPKLKEHFNEFGKYDFDRNGAVYDLSEAILKDSFEVDMELDRSKLCPRIPNRLAYIEWCKNLVAERYSMERSRNECGNIVCVDIGTGSSAVYPLLGVLNDLFPGSNCRFIGTELDSNSITHALTQINKNKLTDVISLVQIDDSNDILRSLVDVIRANEKVYFTMCNPPFYQSIAELVEHSENKPRRGNELIASELELVHEDGGEYGFVKKYIEQSLQLGRPFSDCWFSCQIGLLSTMRALEQYLIELRRDGFIRKSVTEQLVPIASNGLGITKRWVVAWLVSSRYNYPVPKIERIGTVRKPKPLEVTFQQLKNLEYCETWFDESKQSVFLRCQLSIWVRKFSRMLKFQRQRLESVPKTVCVFRITQEFVYWVYGEDNYMWETFNQWLEKS